MDRWRADPGAARCDGQSDAEEPLHRRSGTEVAVRVATDEATIVDNREIPDISLQHLMAVMLVDKTLLQNGA